MRAWQGGRLGSMLATGGWRPALMCLHTSAGFLRLPVGGHVGSTCAQEAGRQEAEPPLGPPCLGPSVVSDASSFESQIQTRQTLCLPGHQKPTSSTHGCASHASAACTGRAPLRPPAAGHLWPLLWGPRVLSLWPCDHPLYVFKAPCFSAWYVRHTWVSQRGPAPISQPPASCFLCSRPSAGAHGTFSHPRAFARAEPPPVRPLKLYSVNKKRGLPLGDTPGPAESIPCPCPSLLSPSEGVLEKLPQSYLPACLTANSLGQPHPQSSPARSPRPFPQKPSSGDSAAPQGPLACQGHPKNSHEGVCHSSRPV